MNRRPTKLIALGDVTFFIRTDTNDTYKGQSKKLVFLPQEKEYRFYTDVYLQQLNNEKVITGDEVIVNTLKGRASAKGAKKKPVIMIFELDEKNETK